jgi:hypothetical protein
MGDPIMNRHGRSIVFAALLLVVCGALPVAGADDPLNIEARADRILREMSDYLMSVDQFRFHSDVSYASVLVSGQMIHYGATGEIAVHRPDRFRVEQRGDEGSRRVVFNGHTFTMHDIEAGLYAQKEMTADIDTAIDRMFERFGFSVPTADLIYADPYSTLTESVDTGFVVGLHEVQGVRCHHLAFSQESIDWQIWIEDGPRPLPRKLLITYKDEPGTPHYAVQLSRWDLRPHISDAYFEFHPPAGTGRIEFLPAEEGGDAP